MAFEIGQIWWNAWNYLQNLLLLLNIFKFWCFLSHPSLYRVECYRNATGITIFLVWDCTWDGNSRACTIQFSMNIFFTTKILPFHPVLNILILPDCWLQTGLWRVEPCCASLRRRDCSSAGCFLTGAWLWSVCQLCPSPKFSAVRSSTSDNLWKRWGPCVSKV